MSQQDNKFTLRDWFAGQVIAGYSAIPDERRCPVERPTYDELQVWRKRLKQEDAKYAYQMADAMMEARKKNGTEYIEMPQLPQPQEA